MRGAIVLAGGPARRMGRAKPLIPVAGVPLVVRVVRAVRKAVDEVVVVTKAAQAPDIREVLPEGVTIQMDSRRIQSPLVGFVEGADAIGSEYLVFLPCDLPLLSPELHDSGVGVHRSSSSSSARRASSPYCRSCALHALTVRAFIFDSPG